MPAESHWTVVHTHPGAEQWAMRNVSRAGYRTYLPLFARRGRDRARRPVTQLVPLFPRYAFVALADGEPWTPIRYAPGVASLLMANGHPAYARAGAVEAVQAGDEMRSAVMPPEALWRPGAACRLASGPFAGQDAVVIRVDGDKALVSLVFLGALHEVAISVEALGARES